MSGRSPSSRFGKERRQSVIASLTKRDGNQCWYCGGIFDGDRSIEHLKAYSSGGANTQDNLVLAHQSCNERVGNYPVEYKRLMRNLLHKANEGIV